MKYDLGTILILFLKDEMVEKGIIPQDVKWDKIDDQTKENVVNFVKNKLEKQKEGDKQC